MVGSRAAAHLDRGRPDWTVWTQGLGSAPLVSRGSSLLSRGFVERVCVQKKVNVTPEASVGGGVAAPSSLNFSRATCVHAP